MELEQMKRNLKCRRYCFTLNNPTEEERDHISAINCEYLLYGTEHQNEGTPHLQGYIVFKNPQSFEALKKFMPRAHIERARFDHETNIRYCTKEDTKPFEKGERPVSKNKQVKVKSILKRDPINGPKIIASEQKLIGMNLEKEMFKEIINGKLEKPEIIYVYGDTGTGKTYYALQDALLHYGWNNVATIRFDKSGFCHCNDPQRPCLVWMEFRPSCLDAASFLELTDGYGTHLNVKHGGMFIRPKRIYICSILPPQEIYREEINQQFMRRITKLVDKNQNPYVNYVDVTEEEAEPADFLSD
nr:MAG: rep protein [Cressdnaviricota sp.]